LLAADQASLAQQLLQPVRDLGYRIRGIVSDDEQALRLAIAQVYPDVAHQTCQLHCLRDAAQPISAADRAFKTALKQAIRAPLYAACRALEQHVSPTDPRYSVLSSYAELLRSTLTEESKPPFALGGLRVFQALARLEASLQRSRKKRRIPCWIASLRWFNCANHSAHTIGNSSANTVGWLNWSAD
jgi:transposase-like protein